MSEPLCISPWEGEGIGLRERGCCVELRASPACEGGFETRPYGCLHNITYDVFMVRSRAPPRCPAPLDSGFRRNDGGYAQRPYVASPSLCDGEGGRALSENVFHRFADVGGGFDDGGAGGF